MWALNKAHRGLDILMMHTLRSIRLFEAHWGRHVQFFLQNEEGGFVIFQNGRGILCAVSCRTHRGRTCH